MRRKTHEEYVEELSKVNPDIVLLSVYKNSRTKVTVKNIKCEHSWEVKPHSLLYGHGCPICTKRVTKGHDQFVEELGRINNDIEITSNYINSNTKIGCRCKICNFTWNALPSDLLRGSGCGKCFGMYVTNEEYTEKLHKVHPHVDLVGNYLGSKGKTRYRCTKHNYEWNAVAKDVLHSKNPCAICESKYQSAQQTWSDEEYKKRLDDMTSTIISLEPYVDSYTNIKHKCLLCNSEFLATPHNVLNNAACPACNCTKGERRIMEYLDANDRKYELQKTFDGLKYKHSLFFDFYLPDNNLLIEYDGEFHYFPIFSEERFETEKLRDSIKDDFAKQNNIQLLRIPYWDFSNINQILDDYLKNIGGKQKC